MMSQKFCPNCGEPIEFAQCDYRLCKCGWKGRWDATVDEEDTKEAQMVENNPNCNDTTLVANPNIAETFTVQHGHPDFYAVLKEMADLHSRKNHDYAGDDPLSNLRACEEIGLPAWKGVLVRLMDKWGRLKQFAKQGMLEVKNESITDTLMDNAVYSILCIILMREEGGYEDEKSTE